MVQMWNEILEEPAVLERCLKYNSGVIGEIVKKIAAKGVNSVYIAARGTSDHAAVYGKYLLEIETGIPVGLAAPSIFTMYQQKLELKNSLVIGVSQSGKAADVLEVIRGAREKGALTISITNFEDSPLATGAEYHLLCQAGEERSVAATKTFVSQIYILAALAAEWAKDGELKKELATVPARIAQTFDVSREIKERVERYRFMNECFVLARGVNYAIALEAALKIQETTYVRAKAFATSDFYHGPLAMVNKDIPMFIFAPDGPSLKDLNEMILKLKTEQVDLMVVSNLDKIRELGVCGFTIPQTNNDIISPFFNVVVAQMFACQLALVKGLNPDAPRGLHKVTVTL